MSRRTPGGGSNSVCEHSSRGCLSFQLVRPHRPRVDDPSLVSRWHHELRRQLAVELSDGRERGVSQSSCPTGRNEIAHLNTASSIESRWGIEPVFLGLHVLVASPSLSRRAS